MTDGPSVTKNQLFIETIIDCEASDIQCQATSLCDGVLFSNEADKATVLQCGPIIDWNDYWLILQYWLYY